MITKPFGWTGIPVPVVGQGTWMIEGAAHAERQAVEALRTGLDLGMVHIDTAEMYGNGRAEELVAEAIAGRRQDVFLTSKVLPSHATYQGTLRACERTLARLKTDYLDLYLLHWHGSHSLSETMRAMEDLVAAKRVRYIGVSNFDVEDVMEAEQVLKRERLACNQVLYHLGDRGIERRLIPYCRKKEIAVVAYSPFGHRSFPQPYGVGGKTLVQVAAKHGGTPRQAALNFLTRDPIVFTIPRSINPDHTRENAAAPEWTLTPDETAAIDRAFPAPDHDVPLGMI